MDLARKAHQSGRLVGEDGLRGHPLAQRTGQGQSSVVAFLVWKLVRLQLEPLNRRRREDGLNSTHIFPVKSTTACTEVTLTGKMWIGPPKDRFGRILETFAVAHERRPFCLRKRKQSRDTVFTLFTLQCCTACTALDEHIHYTHRGRNICRQVQLTPVDLQRGRVKTLL